MQSQKTSKVIFDTNLWISFLIGKELQFLRGLLENEKIQLVITDQLLDELTLVVNRPKLKRYFDKEKVKELISFLKIISLNFTVNKIESVCRDPKDDFLLALSKVSKADFLVTGDKDLLIIGVYGKTKIISVAELKRLTKQ